VGEKIVHLDADKKISLVLNDLKAAFMYTPPQAKVTAAEVKDNVLTIKFSW
jgi:hypothetical protein